MQYQVTESVSGQLWEHKQQSVIDEVRRRALHDLAAQHPGSTVTVDTVNHSLRPGEGQAADVAGAENYLVDFVIEYTVSGEPNPFAA